MNATRRSMIAAALALPCLRLRAAESFPARPVRLVVPNPPGGTVDLVARLVAHGLGESLGQHAMVEPRPGGNTVIGTELVARAAPDGHTVLMVGTPFAINAVLRPLPYDSLRDFAPVARLALLPFVFAVHPSVPARSLAELVALGRARAGALNYASFGLGQLAGESFKRSAAVDMNFIPYQGGVQATAAVVAGHAGVLLAPLSDAMPHIQAGRLRPLAVTSAERSEALPELPTAAEVGHAGFEWTSWIGAAVPAATPRAVVERLAQEMTRAIRRPEAVATLRRLSVSPAPLGPAEFERAIRASMQAYETVVRQAGIKVE